MDNEEQTVPEGKKDKIGDDVTSMKGELIKRGMLQTNTRVRVMVTLFSVLAYILLFTFLFNKYGGQTMAMSAVIPVIVVGWLYGFVPGIFTAVLSLPINILMYEIFGINWLEKIILSGGGIAGTVALIFIGAIVGRMRDLSFQLKRELTERMRAEEELKKHRNKLDDLVKLKTKALQVTNKKLKEEINERKLASEELKETKDYLDNIIEGSLDGIAVSDNVGYITRANKYFLKLIDFEEEEIIGKHIMELSITEKGTYESTTEESVEIGEEFVDDAREITEKLFEEGKISNWENYLIRKDKKVIPVEINISYFYNKEGNITGSVGIFRDITERKKVEKEIREAREFLENIFRTSADGIIINDPNGRITMVNKTVLKMLGYSQDEFIGKHVAELSPEGKMYEEKGHELATKLFEDSALTGLEHTFVRKDGSLVDVEINAAMLNDKKGNITGAVTSFRDITERKLAEKERERFLSELNDKNKELEQVFYVASHDLRSPLVNVQGFSKELEQAFKHVHSVLHSKDIPSTLKEKLIPTLEEDIPEALQYILTSISKMDLLLSGLLRLSRLGRAALNIKKLDVNKLILDVVRSFDFQIKEIGVKLQIDELPPCFGDETQINQVFSNLMGNALKYLDPNRAGVIRISGREENGHAIYYVEDNGIGIAEEHQDKIYEIFRRLIPEQGPGDGLGLTIARRIIDRHAGKIWVESAQSKGSKFFVSLPTS